MILYSNGSFLWFNKKFRKKLKQITAKKYVIACALPETEDHIHSFQVDFPPLYHLKTSGF